MQERKISVSKAMFLYWISVIAWQTIRPVANRSLVDMAVKFGLFALICLYGWRYHNARGMGYVQLLTIFFLLSQSVTYLSDSITLTTVITAVYMFAQILVFLILLGNEKITGKDLSEFSMYMIIASMVMCVYNLTFNIDQFLKLFTSSAGYGSECSSFLYSNHEFAVYLSVSIIFIMWRLMHGEKRKILMFLMLGVAFINLLSTYSRTAILGVLISFMIFMFYYNKKYFVAFALLLAVFFILVNNVYVLYDFFFNRVFKGDSSSGGLFDETRTDMYVIEWNLFKSGNIIQKMFGRGYTGGVTEGHNAYLYILNIGGIVMFVFFAILITWSICNSARLVKLDRGLSALCFSLQAFSLSYMMTQTPILFFSSMDSYFLTVISVLIPLYAYNALKPEKKYAHKMYLK